MQLLNWVASSIEGLRIGIFYVGYTIKEESDTQFI